MIKFFESQDRYNWVTEDGQFIGFSSYQNCCESFGYCYVHRFYEDFNKIIDEENHNAELKKLIESNELEYDNTFEFGELKIVRKEDACGSEDFVSVEIKDFENNCLRGYLVLYNCHNGYYSHGFDFNLKPERQYGCI